MLIFHFQFIVVSLKDGMFNNANVLFRTKFVDGVSTVTRFVQTQPSSRSTSGNNNAGNTAGNKKQKPAKTSKRARIEDIENMP